MKFIVRITDKATRDSDFIYDYIHERSPTGANAWYQALLEALGSLRQHPSGLTLAPEGILFDVDVRQVFFETQRGRKYRALFLVDADEYLVNVIAIRGPSQDLLTAEDLDKAIDNE